MRHKAGIVIALIVVSFVASIAIPNFLVARDRSRQKRTMADMRTISAAWEARATDLNTYTVDPQPRRNAAKDANDFSKLHRVSTADLKRALVPKYLKEFPARDGWGNEMEFRTGDDSTRGGAQLYALRSLGSDKRAEPGAYKIQISTKFEDDLVFSNGVFLRIPEGI